MAMEVSEIKWGMDMALLQCVLGDKTSGGCIHTRGYGDSGTTEIVHDIYSTDNVDQYTHIHKSY